MVLLHVVIEGHEFAPFPTSVFKTKFSFVRCYLIPWIGAHCILADLRPLDAQIRDTAVTRNRSQNRRRGVSKTDNRLENYHTTIGDAYITMLLTSRVGYRGHPDDECWDDLAKDMTFRLRWFLNPPPKVTYFSILTRLF